MESAPPLPGGTVTFLLTDIEEGSLPRFGAEGDSGGVTRLWEEHPDAMRLALARHQAIIAAEIEQRWGVVVKSQGEGDSTFAVFAHAPDALTATCALQKALVAEPWPPETPLRVRVALHTGEADLRAGDYYGPTVNRCARLRAVAHGGQVLLSAATQQRVRDHLPPGATLRDLGERRLKDLSRPEQIFQLLHPELPDAFPALRTLDARPNNLPAQPTPLIGREQEVATVRALLLQETGRLLTLTGPGGAGKTRLGLQVAAEMLDDFPQGVFFVPLAPITDADLVTSAIAQTLGVRESGGQTLRESVEAYLREKRLLSLLDNFEQVLPAAPVVAELLAAAPGLKVLVTSRAALHLRGEKEFPVSPLPVPDPKGLTTPEILLQSSAIALFVQRAVDVKPNFTLTKENAAAVAGICHRLDGLPLAIELAAARTRLLPPQALLSRLERRLPLLVGGARDLPARQQTLRGAIAWSYDLLSEAERALFRRLSVFVGGFTIEAAEGVCNANGGLEVEVLDGLDALVAQSLLRQEEGAGGEPRFGMLETIREYGLECLSGSGELEALRRRHAVFFLELAERAEPELEGAAQVEWLDRLEGELDNLRAALAWSQTAPEGDETGLRLAAALWGLCWHARGPLTEGRRRLDDALARSGRQPRTRAYAKALLAAALLAAPQGKLAAALPLAQESVALWQELGERRELGRALWCLGFLEQTRNVGLGRARIEEGVLLLREVGDRWALAWSLLNLGAFSFEAGDFARAASCFEEGMLLFRQTGDRTGSAGILVSLGEIARLQGDYARAAALNEESWALARATGNKWQLVHPPHNLGWIAVNQGDLERARALFKESLAIWRDLGNRAGVALCLAGLGGAAGALGQSERGARLLGAAATHLAQPTGLAEAADRADRERALAQVRAALGEEAFAAAWAEGQALTLEEAIEHALAEDASGRLP